MKFELNFRNNNGTEQELLEDMNKIANKLGFENLTMREYDENGKFSSATISTRFGSWNKALVKANLKLSNQVYIPELDLFKNLERVWIQLGRQPKRRDMKQPLSKYSERGYITKFGSWRKALESFVEFINTTTDDKEQAPFVDNAIETLIIQEITYKHKTKRQPSERLKVQVLMRDGNSCRLCGVIVTGDNIHFDHIKPWSKGGETILDNLQVLCSMHNLAKGNLEYEEE